MAKFKVGDIVQFGDRTEITYTVVLPEPDKNGDILLERAGIYTLRAENGYQLVPRKEKRWVVVFKNAPGMISHVCSDVPPKHPEEITRFEFEVEV